MSTSLIWLVTALYAGQSGVLAWQGNMPLALVFAGYTIANFGLIWGME